MLITNDHKVLWIRFEIYNNYYYQNQSSIWLRSHDRIMYTAWSQCPAVTDQLVMTWCMNIENTKKFEISQAIKTIHFLYNSIWRIGDVVSINDQDTCSLHNLIMITENLARVKTEWWNIMKITTNWSYCNCTQKML